MVKNNIDNNIQQILISLRSDNYSIVTMRSIVVLAEKLKADIRGVFVEDRDLMHIANLPFSREITLPTANVRNLNSMSMLRHFRSHAENIRKAFNQCAEDASVSCTFVTREGSIIESALSESHDAQLIILMPDKYARPGMKKIDKLEQIINPLLLFYDDSKQARKSMIVIRSLIENNELHQLYVLTARPEHKDAVSRQLKSLHAVVSYYHIELPAIETIVAMFSSQKPGLVILPLGGIPELNDAAMKYLINMLGCILVLVR